MHWSRCQHLSARKLLVPCGPWQLSGTILDVIRINLDDASPLLGLLQRILWGSGEEVGRVYMCV